ncbi:cytidylyltransferase domain-containing protein [Selenomonas sp. oral taxon 149]|uniref:acylneuraminate cytidylyltransferase family protein n=1 Tax=Selenomonas sp. oral taxon 149 TaxID=712535 RepID=UPI00031614B9|nr:acylneuraminate cytidylyltransferase family protein [Selenomonas sp. oral taxon 149]
MSRSKLLAVLPARGGSKGIPKKNIRLLGGKPLIAYTIEAAKGVSAIDRLIVSTDDAEIAEVAREYGADVPFLRPKELAGDAAPVSGAILHLLNAFPAYDSVLLLQPTSPFRQKEDIEGFLSFAKRSAAKVCVSVTEVEHSPYWMYTVEAEDRLKPILPLPTEAMYQRQKLPSCYRLNGALYYAQTAYYKEHKTFLTEDTLGYTMDRRRSLDIDTEEDLVMAEWILANRREEA